jgi:hypothetical protein
VSVNLESLPARKGSTDTELLLVYALDLGGVTLRFISIKLGTRASFRLAWGTGAEVPVVADEDGGAAAASPVMAAVVLVATADDSTPSAAPPFAGCRLFF